MDASSDYYESENFKRKNLDSNHDEEESLENLKNFDYIRELIKERNQLDSDSHASRLLDQGMFLISGKIYVKIRTILSILFSCCFIFPFLFRNPEIQNAKASGKPFRDNRYVDVYREKQIRVVVKCIVPVKEHPKVKSQQKPQKRMKNFFLF
jgi:hypothetical protein